MLGIIEKPPNVKSRGLFKLVSKESDLCDNSALQFLKKKGIINFLIRTESTIYPKVEPTSIHIENSKIWVGSNDGWVYIFDSQTLQQSFHIFKKSIVHMTSSLNFFWVKKSFFTIFYYIFFYFIYYILLYFLFFSFIFFYFLFFLFCFILFYFLNFLNFYFFILL